MSFAQQFDAFGLSLTCIAHAKRLGIELKPMPDKGPEWCRDVTVDTPDGYYFCIIEHAANLIIVGESAGALSRQTQAQAYFSDMIPGYKLSGMLVLPVPERPELTGRFLSLEFTRIET